MSASAKKSKSATQKKQPQQIDWQAKRREIIGRLGQSGIRELYESWGARFKGRPNGKKWPCRAIRDGCPDNNASAVVYLDKGGYHDSGAADNNCGDIFDAAVKFGGAADSSAALRFLADKTGVELPPSRSANPAKRQPGQPERGSAAAKPPIPAPHVPLPKGFFSDTDPHFWAKAYLEKTNDETREKGKNAYETLKKNKILDSVPTIRFYRGVWYLWLDGRWVFTTKEDVKLKLTKFIREEMDERGIVKVKGDLELKIEVTPEIVGATQNALASEVQLEVDADMDMPFWIERDGTFTKKSYLAAQNGLLDLDKLVDEFSTIEDSLLPLSPRWFSQVRLPYEVRDTGGSCKWDKFLRSSVTEDGGAKVDLLQQFCGYLLLPNTNEQKFLIMVGEGSNGKSVACAGIMAMLGVNNVSNVPFELFSQRFALTQTLGKLANVVSEIGELDKSAEGHLKQFTDGSRMFFDRKGMSPLNAKPTAKLVLATNNIPRFSDRTKALWRRMIVMPFNVEIKKDRRIKGMDKPEFWAEDAPGIFAWAVEGLRNLNAQDHFTESPECEAALREHQRECNPARVFLEETCAVSEDGSVPTQDLYQNYREWCEKNGTHPLGERIFGKEVKRAFPFVKRDRCGTRWDRYWSYIGIEHSLKGFEEPQEEPQQDEFDFVPDPAADSAAKEGDCDLADL